MLRNRYLYNLIAFLSLCAATCACTSDSFHVDGTIAGVTRQNLRAVYYADGAMRMVPVMVEGGKFSFDGRSADPAMVELYTSDRSLLGRFVAANGDKINCSFDRADPWNVTIEGNDLSDRWASFIRKNAAILGSGSQSDVNALVAGYVDGHAADPLSSLLLLTLYDSRSDPRGAADLLDKTDPDYRPRSLMEGYEHLLAAANDSAVRAPVKTLRVYGVRDSMTTVSPSRTGVTLISLSTSVSGRSDSIVRRFRALSKGATGRRLSIVDLSLDTDTAAWRASIAADTARWFQGWLPGGLGSSAVGTLGVSSVPFFIVTDSAGRQLYRGAALSEAVTTVETFLK